ncbi:hypothetical protein Ddye_000727 [Dipteronia dyeriana]|uniref:MULE transposase domain-containing protein n=1 Tax=Dipteronia dyeriana TaxID=168575 RepID=A0AAD9XNL2_9ROSI|nr:hypothetical protein Ddye_000727 [Dipteronia dyeriana]
MEKRVGGGICAGGDAHVHKLPPSFFKYDNVGCYTTESDTKDEKPNEHDYPSSSDDTFIRVKQGVSGEDGIGGTKNYGGVGGVTFGGPSHDPFPIAPSRWILPCIGQYSFGTTPAASTSQEGPLFVGQVFKDKHKLKIELGLYVMHERFDIRVRRSIKYRFEADYKDINCQFTIGAVRKEHCTFWQVKKFIKTHTCEGDMYGGQFQVASANVIGQLYAPKLSNGANICPKDIMRDIREKHGVELLYMKVWMAMQHARSTGFQSVIRLVVAIDATHLKTDYGGVMFVATCKDGTYIVYPLAFGFRDGKTDEAWTWFLLHIREVIGTPEHLVVISNRHNSIANGMRNVYPTVPHCICYYHLKQNLKKDAPKVIGTPEHLVVIFDRHNSIANGMRNVYPTVPHCICYYHWKQNPEKDAPKGGDVLQLYKLAAYSYRTEVCDKYLTDISNIHRRAFDYLIDVGVERWSLAYCLEKRYGFMTTNITEAINFTAKEARKLPITTLVEFLRDLMQK